MKWFYLGFFKILTNFSPHILTFSLRFITISSLDYTKFFLINIYCFCFSVMIINLFKIELFDFQPNLNHRQILMTNWLNSDRRTQHRSAWAQPKISIVKTQGCIPIYNHDSGNKSSTKCLPWSSWCAIKPYHIINCNETLEKSSTSILKINSDISPQNLKNSPQNPKPIELKITNHNSKRPRPHGIISSVNVSKA